VWGTWSRGSSFLEKDKYRLRAERDPTLNPKLRAERDPTLNPKLRAERDPTLNFKPLTLPHLE
jgi:hypothetical protein